MTKEITETHLVFCLFVWREGLFQFAIINQGYRDKNLESGTDTQALEEPCRSILATAQHCNEYLSYCLWVFWLFRFGGVTGRLLWAFFCTCTFVHLCWLYRQEWDLWVADISILEAAVGWISMWLYRFTVHPWQYGERLGSKSSKMFETATFLFLLLVGHCGPCSQ